VNKCHFLPETSQKSPCIIPASHNLFEFDASKIKGQHHFSHDQGETLDKNSCTSLFTLEYVFGYNASRSMRDGKNISSCVSSRDLSLKEFSSSPVDGSLLPSSLLEADTTFCQVCLPSCFSRQDETSTDPTMDFRHTFP
jgi:hypothetical protein